MAAYKKLIS